ncbi:TonB-dependent receptor family protein [Chitinophaga horti]|uniref:TonB-dependent receptor family protein n=1 Tax=Chitinophaga horti TaxID=2920382 RepID=A0ABY6J435_9BACT|nr:outer membrane beta-barrel family protein [Chitinophaga horti]UYQ94270.1 TonB-dependent receptor family protein [Chitinophaga horti]
MKRHSKMLPLSMLLVFATAMPALAQTKVTGQVNQADNKPVPFATVTLLKAKDSTLAKGAVADIDGKYQFEQVAAGKYLVAAVNMGMKKSFSQPFEVKNAPFQLPALLLGEDVKKLKEVNVTGKRPFIEQKADKMVVNVENSIVAAGGTAMEVLEKAPGVQVDKDDNISMKGKGGVIVMIDGKPTNMTSQDVAQLLKNMPSSNIDQIELIANPSAKYDAAGNAGIINIKLKKNKNYGTNGNVSLVYGQGKLPKANGSFNLNHRNERLNAFASYNYNYNRNFENLEVYRKSMDQGRQVIFDQANYIDKSSHAHNTKLGLDYFLNKHHTIGVMADLNKRVWEGPGSSITKMGDGLAIDSNLITNSENDRDFSQTAFNLNYKGRLDSAGKELNIDLDFSRTDQQNGNLMKGAFRGPDLKHYMHGDTVRSQQPSRIEIRTAKADYVHPLKNGAKLEAGFKVSFVKSDNNARFDSLKLQQWEFDANRSNHFIYEENVNAAYINFSKQFKKLGVQAGLRGEQSNVKGSQMTTAQVNDTSYFNLFPSVFLSYTANEKNMWGVSYSRRLQRPSYDNLNPFEFYLDRYTKTSGNPGLKPQYSNNFEVNHTFRQFLTTSLGYTHTKDMITRVIEADEDFETGDTTILKYKYMNVAKRDNFNLGISAPFPITKWWNSFVTISAFYNRFQTVVDGEQIDRASAGFFGQTQHTFKITKGMSAEASYYYSSPQVTNEGLFRMRAMHSGNIGLQQLVLKKQGTLRVNVNDVFNTNRFSGTYEASGQQIRLSNRWDSRQLRVSFTYRFGNMNVKEARKRRTGIEDEQNRVK